MSKNTPAKAKTEITIAKIGIITAVVSVIGVLITAFFAYLTSISQIEIPLHATQTAQATVSIQTAPNEVVIKLEIQDKTSGKNIENAIVSLQIGTEPTVINISGSDGIVRFFVDSEQMGLPVKLSVEVKGYEIYKQEIDIKEQSLTIPLSPIEIKP